METITNAASSAATTVSNLLYGQPAAKDNETLGNEPVSGEQGKGTATEPFDKGNSEDPTTSTKTAGSDDFLQLNPALGKSATTDATTDVKTGTSNETSMPIIPLNPDAANLGTGATATSTGITDKAGVTDTVWKPTPLDEVKRSGAPGAGPDAPSNVTPATPAGVDSAAAPKKESATETTDKVDSTKDTATAKDTPASHPAQTTSISPEVDAVIKGEHPKTEHSVPEAEAESAEAKMEDKTKRNTTTSKPDTTGEAPVAESSEKKNVDSSDKKTVDSSEKKTSESKSPERSSSGNGPEEKDSKMSNLKDKLKTKLHIGSKDK